MSMLRELLTAAETERAPIRALDRRGVVDGAYVALLAALDAPDAEPIYGLNLRVGHRVREGEKPTFSSDEQLKLLESHTLSGPPYFDRREARCVCAAKLLAIAAGGSLISGPLYETLIAAFEAGEFDPKIPKLASYSSGDVIPGAHFASAVLRHAEAAGRPHALRPGEALACMNGAFVHVGYAASLFPKALDALCAYVELARLFVRLTEQPKELGETFGPADATFATAAIAYVYADARPADGPLIQPPVSVRALFETIDAYGVALEGFARVVEREISAPSNNPLVRLEGERVIATPSASFLAPTITLATSSMIEAAMLLGWSVVAHAHYLHRGEGRLPLDLATERQPFGAVQRPKYMQAILERARHRAGTRAFSTGGWTSYGEEDLWTFGVSSAETLDDVLDAIFELQHEALKSLTLAAEILDRRDLLADGPSAAASDVESFRAGYAREAAAPLRSALRW